ncbi:YgaP family membrane protein [Candidatus Nanohalobium constans]|uniref:Inner membrane protein YgaP-like transmembrane domain-containing protein n=1 Tax=Candidatus Nanohalobium constans TaxID=2565781 RepID=A0A5Q0UH60_9ARCH|nr:DUF2892 domain-containing protein [Candidatus Nanohalobium constans]QGA80701.1 hypothetical protein LC1Nh_0817 [Candidatus Nanohalobium constans]
MEENVGDTDSIVRITLGAVAGLLSLGILADVLPSSLTLPEIASPILGVVAIALLATGFTSKCGLYSVLGMDTRE